MDVHPNQGSGTAGNAGKPRTSTFLRRRIERAWDYIWVAAVCVHFMLSHRKREK